MERNFLLLLRILLLFSLVPCKGFGDFNRSYREQILDNSYNVRQLELLRNKSYDKGKLLSFCNSSVLFCLSGSNQRRSLAEIMDIPIRSCFLHRNTLKRISRFEALIDYYSRRYSIESNLIKAIIYVESSGNPRTISPKGAKGLMQLMPDTAVEVGVRDIFNPAENIAGGTKFLHRQLERFGKVPLALWAYHAGPGMVTRQILPLTTYYYILKVLWVKSLLDKGL